MMTTPGTNQFAHFNLIAWNSGDRFEEQVTLLKSAGASFDGSTRTWWLPLERAVVGERPGIDILFEAAKRYGTVVRVEPRAPREG